MTTETVKKTEPMPRTSLADEIEIRRRAPGTALWGIEVFYYVENEVRKHHLQNQLTDEMMKFRDVVYRCGVMLPIDPGHWVIISPSNIKEIHLYKQAKFFTL